MVVAGQRRPWSLGRVVWFVVSAVLVGMLVAGVLWTQRVQPASDTPVVQRPAVDVNQLDTYWATYSGVSWYGLAQQPSWDGAWLSVRTSLWADADARVPASQMCAALENFWVTTGQRFGSVRVLDAAGNVLVSRRVESDPCTWRR